MVIHRPTAETTRTFLLVVHFWSTPWCVLWWTTTDIRKFYFIRLKCREDWTEDLTWNSNRKLILFKIVTLKIFFFLQPILIIEWNRTFLSSLKVLVNIFQFELISGHRDSSWLQLTEQQPAWEFYFGCFLFWLFQWHNRPGSSLSVWLVSFTTWLLHLLHLF